MNVIKDNPCKNVTMPRGCLYHADTRQVVYAARRERLSVLIAELPTVYEKQHAVTFGISRGGDCALDD
jgi:hypothetical protein